MSYTYKSITLPWLLQMPEHWKLVRNKTLFLESKTTVGSEYSKYQLLSLTKNGVIIRDLSHMKGKFPSDFGTYKTVNDGQIIFCLFDIDETPRIVGLSKYNGMITGAYDIFSIEGANSRFLEYYYISLDDVKAMRPLYTGLRKVIGVNTFMQTHLLLPPRDEQDQIVCCLNWKVSQINRLINAKRRQIELLREHKQVMINESVTTGGEGWQEVHLRNLGSFRKGFGGSRADDCDDGVACIRYGDIYRTGVLSLINPITRISRVTVGSYARVFKSEVLFALSGETKAEIGQALINNIDEDTWCSGDVAVFTANENIIPNFLAYALRCPYTIEQKISMARGDIIVHISTNALRRLRILVPPNNEQKIIVSQLDAKCSVFERLIQNKNKQIDLLTEYRTRYISDAVTGKLDVRSVVVPEYEDILA